MTHAPDPRQSLQDAIQALESQRALLGEAVVDAALGPLRERLAALRPAAAAQRQLRQVSVLFLDIVGSTRMTQQLDPEEVQQVMDGALASFTSVVRQHAGEVLQYAGDSLLAAFGADGAREDDAERAVRAGLALLLQALHWGRLVQQQHGLQGFNARVGIHTGSVLRGGGVDEENTLRGLAVNIAARMEQASAPGTLRVSQDTWALVRGLFVAEPQAPLQVKGCDEPITSWLVQRALPRAFALSSRGVEGLQTPLVGRSAEVAQLRAALEAVLQTGRPRALTVVADAGLGKSRLLHDFQGHLAAHTSRLRPLLARAHPGSALQPYGLLRDLLSRRLEIADSDSADLARSKLVQGLAPWLDQAGDPAPELVGQLIGLDFAAHPAVALFGSDARLLRNRALSALRTFLQRVATREGTPAVMLLDDLQWADDASLDALQDLLGHAAETPLLLLMGARPGLLERRADWGQGLPAHERITLTPLSETDRHALTAQLLSRLPRPPAALLQLIEQRAEGNPFYAEELVKMLLDRGVLHRGSGAWTFNEERLQSERLPTTLVGVLQARIDALAPPEQRALRMASVIGAVFWDDALASLDPDGPQALPQLQRKSMVQARSHSAFEGTSEEVFHHHLLHQVSYETVLKSERRNAHARAAAWLTDRVGERSDEYLAITAQHHERAGHAREAADWYLRASKMASDRSAAKLALQYLDRADALPLDIGPEEQVQRLQWRIAACDQLAWREPQAEAVGRLLQLGETHENEFWVSYALSQQSFLAERLGRLEESQALARRALEVAERCNDAPRAALCRGNLAWAAAVRHDLADAREQVDRALAWARQAKQEATDVGSRVYEPQMLLIKSYLHAQEGDDQARGDALAQAWALVQDLQAPRLHGSCLEYMGEHAIQRADLPQARQLLESMQLLSHQVGMTMHQAMSSLKLADLCIHEGGFAQAERLARDAAAGFGAAGARRYCADALNMRADALWRQGLKREAMAQWFELVGEWRALDEEVIALTVQLRWAQAACEVGTAAQAAEALSTVRAALPQVQRVHALAVAEFGLSARLAAWQVLRQAGDPQAAQQLALAVQERDDAVGRIADSAVRQRVLSLTPKYRDLDDALAQRALA